MTGGCGFIGSNIIKALNQRGEDNIIIIDDLTDGKKFKNIADLRFQDYLDKQTFIQNLSKFNQIKVIFHQGACSDTTEWNGKFMMENNYEYSKTLFNFCLHHPLQPAFVYASSAAVYGSNTVCQVDPAYEAPLNIYGYSKLLFDLYIRRYIESVIKPAKNKKVKSKKMPQIAGLRYFNVYGPREQHKGKMASMAFHGIQQLEAGNNISLFEGSGGYNNGGQRRDFIYVKDIADINIWLWEHPEISGIFNAGTGKSQTFNDIANSLIKYYQKGKIEYIPFPGHLKGCYQHYTQADMSGLRKLGYEREFYTVEKGIKDYLDEITTFSLK